MKKFFRRALTAILLVAGLLTASVAGAEVKTYTGVGEYYMSDFETPEIAKERAQQRAERNACEQAGTYVKSFSRTVNFEFDEDVIETMTSGILKILNAKEQREIANDNLTLIRIIVIAQIDSDDVLKWNKKSYDEREQLIAQNEALRKANDEQEKLIASLKKQLAAVKTQQEKDRITQEFAVEDKKFLSNQKVDKGWKLWEQKDFNGAKKFFDEAINYNPNNAQAWWGRGTAYDELKQYEQAISDLNKAIQLDPKNPVACYNLGISYYHLKQYEQAVQSFDKAIQLKPNYAKAYNNRGTTYDDLGQYERAIQDYDKAIQLKPNYVRAYNNRGWAYYMLKQYERAIQDFDKVLELDPGHTRAKNNRDKCLKALGK